MTPFKIVIPARYDSTRLPGKPLKKLNGISLIEHVYNAASRTDANEIIVATDHKEIMDTVIEFGGKAVMTKPDHLSGTDRIHEVSTIMAWEPSTIVVNLQGDEPLVLAENIHILVNLLAENKLADMSTLAIRTNNIESIMDTNTVKVVVDKSNFALYFSRAPIPWSRDNFNTENLSSSQLPTKEVPFLTHVGLYAYRVNTLNIFSTLTPSNLEITESLEQLRLLSNGMKIIVSVSEKATAHGVDTLEDLRIVEKILLEKN